MAAEPAVTIEGLFDRATARFKAAGVAKPRREASRIWAYLSRTEPGTAYLERGRGADPEIARGFEAAVTRRVAGEPLAYVVGSTGFRHLEIQVDRRVLIPRPETEGLIDHALARVRTGAALDLGTGSGCLALALAQEGSFDEVVGADISAEALELAASNAARCGLSVTLVRSDVGRGLSGRRFDLVVSNPPYLSEEEYGSLDPSVRDWEPRLALLSGADGLDATRRILSDGNSLVMPGGWLVMELDCTRSNAAAGLARAAGWTDVNVLDDLFGRPRYLVARRELPQ